MPVYIATKAPDGGTYADQDSLTVRFHANNKEAAEAYCLMHDLKLEGLHKKDIAAGGVEESDPADDWKRGKPASQRTGPGKGDALLTKNQKATLCQLAGNVFQDLDAMGLIDAEGDTASKRLQNWRRDEVKKCIGFDSLTKCRNSHYRRLHNHFSSMTGRQYENPQMKCTGPQTSMRDTMEAREQAFGLIDSALKKHEQVVNAPATAPEISYSEHANSKGGLFIQAMY